MAAHVARSVCEPGVEQLRPANLPGTRAPAPLTTTQSATVLWEQPAASAAVRCDLAGPNAAGISMTASANSTWSRLGTGWLNALS